MNRTVRWLLLIASLIVVGLWPTALTPVTLAAAGAATVIAAVPGPVLLAVAVIGWLKHKPESTTPAKPTA